MAEFTRQAAERVKAATLGYEARSVNVRPFTRRWPIGDEGGDAGVVIVCFGAFSQGQSVSATVKASGVSGVSVGDVISVSDYCGEYYNTSGCGCGSAFKIGAAWYFLRVTCPAYDAGCCAGSGSGS